MMSFQVSPLRGYLLAKTHPDGWSAVGDRSIAAPRLFVDARKKLPRCASVRVPCFAQHNLYSLTTHFHDQRITDLNGVILTADAENIVADRSPFNGLGCRRRRRRRC